MFEMDLCCELSRGVPFIEFFSCLSGEVKTIWQTEPDAVLIFPAPDRASGRSESPMEGECRQDLNTPYRSTVIQDAGLPLTSSEATVQCEVCLGSLWAG